MMWHSALLVVGVITTGTLAYAPITWMKASKKGIVLMPRGFRGNAQGLSPPQDLIIGQPDKNSPSMVPYFTAKADNAITWDDMGWCVEAGGRKSGDVVRVNQCHGGAAQKWNWIPDRHGRNMIQLKDSSQCLEVKGGLSGAPIALQDCASEMMASWKFEEWLPLPTQAPSQSLGSDMVHAMVALVALSGVGLLSLGAWLQRPLNNALMVTASQGGVSMVNRESSDIQGSQVSRTVLHVKATAEPGETEHSVVYLVRHGQSTWNRAAKRLNLWSMLSCVDHPLTDVGVQQAKRLSEVVENAVATGDADAALFAADSTHVFSSPLTRAVSTSVVALGSKRRIVLLPGAREFSWPLAGPDSKGTVVAESIAHRAMNALCELDPEYCPSSPRHVPTLKAIDVSGAREKWWSTFRESRSDMRLRLKDLISTRLCHDSGACVLVSHSVLIRQLFRDFCSPRLMLEKPDLVQQLRTRKLENCGVVRAVLNADGLIVNAELVFDSKLV